MNLTDSQQDLVPGLNVIFDAEFKVLICRTHGFSIPPTPQGIKRHLRGPGHRCMGNILNQAVATFLDLSLSSIIELQNAVLSGAQPTKPVPTLQILNGWSCLSCDHQYLTTSLELVQRHSASEHGKTRSDDRFWSPCKLQTFFQETRQRKYFRVALADTGRDAKVHSDAFYPGTRNQSHGTLPARQPAPAAFALKQDSSRPIVSLWPHHPFAYVAKQHVPWFSLVHIDRLFRSEHFQTASEPLFNPGHVDTDQSMHAVFPNCHRDPLFYTALLFAMVQSESSGTMSTDAMVLQSATIRLLKQQLQKPTLASTIMAVGAIMLLKTTAYKCSDTTAHSMHAMGLKTILESMPGQSLNSGIKRAVFWQDVYAAVLLEQPRDFGMMDLWDKSACEHAKLSEPCQAVLPSGFALCHHLLPSTLLECIINLVQLQKMLLMTSRMAFNTRYHSLDSMQATIESQLTMQAFECKLYSPVAEATRLGILLCCYCSWTEVWNDKAIPCKIAGKLFDRLMPILAAEDFSLTWKPFLSLLIWLLFVGASVTEDGGIHAQSLIARRRSLLTALIRYTSADEIASGLVDASRDFLYCGKWSWVDFEMRITEVQTNDKHSTANTKLASV